MTERAVIDRTGRQWGFDLYPCLMMGADDRWTVNADACGIIVNSPLVRGRPHHWLRGHEAHEDQQGDPAISIKHVEIDTV